MEFGDLFSKSWKEYKKNFKLFFKIFLLFSLIPSAIFILLIIISGEITNNPNLLIASLPLMILNIIMTISLIYIALQRKNLSFKQSIKGGLHYFWKYIGLSLLLFICLIPLFLLLIIPGLIFSIYWSFSPYILMNENTGIWESMKKSKSIVKGKWWKVFGYVLLLGIIVGVISLIFSTPKNILDNLSNFPKGIEYSVIYFITNIIKSFAILIITPLTILFYKNFYFDLRKKISNKKRN